MRKVYNQETKNEWARNWRHNNPIATRKYQLRKVGISPEKYDELMVEQNNACAICHTSIPGGKKKHFCSDHSHLCCPGRKSCGECLRGLLCSTCNLVIGLIKDDIIIAEAVVTYLKEYND